MTVVGESLFGGRGMCTRMCVTPHYDPLGVGGTWECSPRMHLLCFSALLYANWASLSFTLSGGAQRETRLLSQ